jgi:hypothetical protein
VGQPAHAATADPQEIDQLATPETGEQLADM